MKTRKAILDRMAWLVGVGTVIAIVALCVITLPRLHREHENKKREAQQRYAVYRDELCACLIGEVASRERERCSARATTRWEIWLDDDRSRPSGDLDPKIKDEVRACILRLDDARPTQLAVPSRGVALDVVLDDIKKWARHNHRDKTITRIAFSELRDAEPSWESISTGAEFELTNHDRSSCLRVSLHYAADRWREDPFCSLNAGSRPSLAHGPVCSVSQVWRRLAARRYLIPSMALLASNSLEFHDREWTFSGGDGNTQVLEDDCDYQGVERDVR